MAVVVVVSPFASSGVIERLITRSFILYRILCRVGEHPRPGGPSRRPVHRRRDPRHRSRARSASRDLRQLAASRHPRRLLAPRRRSNGRPLCRPLLGDSLHPALNPPLFRLSPQPTHTSNTANYHSPLFSKNFHPILILYSSFVYI